jgi:predicted transport protein
MGDIRLYRTTGKTVSKIEGSSISIEKSLQGFIESHLNELLGVRFLETEYSTGKTHGGRIDTLGIDENECPVILEYKQSMNENVMNQGLYYLDWLLDHKGEFELLVLKKYGKETADKIEWGNPRILCIAGDFTKFDIHAVQQISSSIELIRYRNYPPDLFLLELVNVTSSDSQQAPISSDGEKKGYTYKTVYEYFNSCDSDVQDRYEALKAFAEALGDDVQVKILKYYIAFKRINNFMGVEFAPQKKEIRVFLKIDPSSIKLEKGFSRDVSNIGHYAPGDLELIIVTDSDLEKAKPLIAQSYDKM